MKFVVAESGKKMGPTLGLITDLDSTSRPCWINLHWKGFSSFYEVQLGAETSHCQSFHLSPEITQSIKGLISQSKKSQKSHYVHNCNETSFLAILDKLVPGNVRLQIQLCIFWWGGAQENHLRTESWYFHHGCPCGGGCTNKPFTYNYHKHSLLPRNVYRSLELMQSDSQNLLIS